MIRHSRTISLAATLALLCAQISVANENEQTEARRLALELAGAWSNDGFKLRDGHLTGELKAGESRLVQVNLYSGNEYWFTAATIKGGKIAIAVYDENGKPLASEQFREAERAAAGFAPPASGPFWIKISVPEGKAAPFAFVYSYK